MQHPPERRQSGARRPEREGGREARGCTGARHCGATTAANVRGGPIACCRPPTSGAARMESRLQQHQDRLSTRLQPDSDVEQVQCDIALMGASAGCGWQIFHFVRHKLRLFCGSNRTFSAGPAGPAPSLFLSLCKFSQDYAIKLNFYFIRN